MHKLTAGFAIALLIGAQASGQTSDQPVTRVLQFTHTQSVQDFQEITNMIRVLADIRQMDTDNSARKLSLSGTAEQIELAEWFFKQLDQTTPPTDTAPLYKAGDNDIVRLYFLSNTLSVQEFQEIANAVRTTAEVRRAFTENAQRVFAIRGTQDQAALVSNMIQDLSNPTNAKTSTITDEYQIAADDLMRIFRLPNAGSVRDFQEIANLTRTITGMRRAFTVNGEWALALRGTPDELALATWLIQQFDEPATPPSPAKEYRAGADDLVRVYFLKPIGTATDFQKAVTSMRAGVGLRQLFTEESRRAVAVRGTQDQMALCDSAIQKMGL